MSENVSSANRPKIDLKCDGRHVCVKESPRQREAGVRTHGKRSSQWKHS